MAGCMVSVQCAKQEPPRTPGHWQDWLRNGKQAQWPLPTEGPMLGVKCACRDYLRNSTEGSARRAGRSWPCLSSNQGSSTYPAGGGYQQAMGLRSQRYSLTFSRPNLRENSWESQKSPLDSHSTLGPKTPVISPTTHASSAPSPDQKGLSAGWCHEFALPF
jgi:hypothetical protein